MWFINGKVDDDIGIQEIADANEQAYDGVYGRVLTAVVCGLGGRMPAGILQDQDAEEVSGFVVDISRASQEQHAGIEQTHRTVQLDPERGAPAARSTAVGPAW